MHTTEHEKQALRKRLRRDPLFIVEHVPWLGSAIMRALRNRVIARFGRRHRGRKLRPDWFSGADRLFHSGTSPAALCDRLPIYVRHAPAAGCTQPAGPSPSGADTAHGPDAEDYLAEQRWSHLTIALLGGDVDWQGATERCKLWIAAHADKHDPAWEPYSAGERLSNLLVFLSAMPRAERMRLVTSELCRFAEFSTAWIFRHVEYYGPAETNNHVLNNARALVLGGWATGSGPAFSAGMQTFRRWLPELVSAGGFLRERSSHYQLVVLSWILDAWRFAQAAGMCNYASCKAGDAEFLGQYAQRMLQAGGMLCAHHSRLLALVGDVSPDADPGVSIQRLAVLYADQWTVPEPAPDRVVLVDDWFRVADGRHLIIGNFPNGVMPQKFSTHGHNDATSFAWLYCGTEVLIDPGRHRYTRDPISLQQVAADAHNVPTVNGLAPLCESLKAGAQLRPIPYATAVLNSMRTGAGVVLAHTGFARATPVARHTRTIEANADGVRVEDVFEGEGVVDVELHWQFAPAFSSLDPARLTMCGAGGEVNIEVSDSERAATWRAKASAGWMSRSYGRVIPITALCLASQVRLPARIVTSFRLKLAQRPSA